MGNKRSLKGKRNPSAVDNWAKQSGKSWEKSKSDNALKKLKASRAKKNFKLVPNPKGKGMIEIEIKMEYIHCDKCGGTSYTYEGGPCENPECPNMPCCGKPKEECTCNK